LVGGVLKVTVTSMAVFPLLRSGALRTRAFLTVSATPGSTRISRAPSAFLHAGGF
jgi:hypothetical protein